MKTHEEFVKNLDETITRELYEAGITDTSDPWATVRVVDYWDGPRAYDAEDVDRARAAVEAQHRQAIAQLTKIVDGYLAVLTQEAERRDALRQEIAGLREAIAKATAIYDNEGYSVEHLAYEMYTALAATEEGTK